MMKKFTLAALALLVSGSVLAGGGGNGADNKWGTGTAAVTQKEALSVSKQYAYGVAANRESRLFVKNAFDFTLSANVALATQEDEKSRFMAVGTINSKGRNFFTGHSDGGSVSSCGDQLSAEDAKTKATAAELVTTYFDSTKNEANGCKK